MPLDYSGQNFRGRSFRGRNLEGANFSSADIRGADFTNAKLRGANFTGAKAGLQKRRIVNFALAVLLGAILSFIVAFAFIQGGWFYPSNPQVNGTALVVFIIIGSTAISQCL
ncbi:hypothetical protein F7734_49230 [Scytonema sp. UIC 10036]|nr:hypothetical protein [Scytonema sp. UIC 10036]